MQHNHFVGRNTEQHIMLNLYEQMCAGSSKILLVSGGAGCGKSALLNHFANKIDHNKLSVVISFSCRYYSAAVSYYALCQVVANIETANKNREFFNTASPQQVADFFYNILRNKAYFAPIIILADDLQYCNPVVYQMIFALLQQLQRFPISVMAILAFDMSDRAVAADSLANRISRGLFSVNIGNILEAWQPDCIYELVLEPLKLSDIANLLAAMYPKHKFPSDTANVVYSISNGNAAHAVALLQNIRSDGSVNSNTAVFNHKTYKYPNRKPKVDTTGNLKDLLTNAIDAVSRTSMLEALQYADSVIAGLARYKDTDAVFEYRASSLQVRRTALTWLGYYNEALDTARELLQGAKQHNKKFYEAAAYYFCGIEYINMAKYPNGSECLNVALSIVGQYENHPAIPDCHYGYGKMYLARNDFNHAKFHLTKALELYNQLNYKEKCAAVSIDLASVVRFAKNYDEACNMLNSSIEFFTNEEYKPDQLAKAYINLGLTYDAQGLFEQAHSYYTKALQLCYNIGDRINMANCYNDIGFTFANAGLFEQANENYVKALRIDEEFNDIPKLALTYNNIGLSMMSINDLTKAEEYLAKALSASQKTGRLSDLSLSYCNYGLYFIKKNNDANALEYYKLALYADKESDDKEGMVSDSNSIGNLYSRLGNNLEALSYYRNSLAIAQELGDKASIAAVYNNFGSLFLAEKRFDKAMDYYTQALEINVELKDNAALALNYYNLGGVYEGEENFARAETYYWKALDYVELTSDVEQKATIISSLAALYYRTDRHDKAKELYKNAADIYLNADNMPFYTDCLRNAAECMRMLSENQEAESTLRKCIDKCVSFGDKERTALAYTYLGTVFVDNEDILRAEECFRKSMDLYKQNGDNSGYCESFYNLAMAFNEFEQYDDALMCLSEIINLYKDNGDLESANDRIIDKASIYITKNDFNRAAHNYIVAAEYYRSNNLNEKYADTIYDAAMALFKTDKKSEGFNYLSEAIDVLQQCDTDNARNALIRCLTAAADFFYDEKKYRKAIEYYDKARVICVQIKDFQHLGYLNNNIGYTYDTMCNYYDALHYYLYAYQAYVEAGNSNEGVFNNLKNAALMYEKLGVLPQAVDYYQKAYAMRRNVPQQYDSRFGDCAIYAANLLKNLSRYSEAYEYYHIAYNEYKAVDQEENVIIALTGEALSLILQNKPQKGEEYCSKFFTKHDSTSDVDLKCCALKAVAQVKLALGFTDDAIKYYQKAISIQLDRDKWNLAANYYYDMATLFATNIDSLPESISYYGQLYTKDDFIAKLFTNVKNLAHSENDYELEVLSYSALANISLRSNDTDKALQIMDSAIEIGHKSDDKGLEITSMLDKADLLRRNKRDFLQAESIIADATELASGSDDFDLMTLCSAYFFMLLVDARRYDEALLLYDKYKYEFAGLYQRLPDVLYAEQELKKVVEK